MAFLALGLTLPLLMLQDSWRFAFFALGRGSQAFLNDSVWAVGLIIGLVYLRYAGLSNVFWYVFAWGAAAGIGAAVGLLQTRVVPKLSGARGWLSRQRDLGFRYVVEGASYSAAGLVRNYGIGLILGLTALGYIQAASTLMGPFQVILYGLALATLPEAIRILQRSPRHMMVFLRSLQCRTHLGRAGLGRHALGRAPERTRRVATGSDLEADLRACPPDDVLHDGRMRQCRSRDLHACPRGGAPECPRRDLHIDLLPRRLPDRRHRRWGRRCGVRRRRCCFSRIGRLLVATARDAQGDAWHTHTREDLLERHRGRARGERRSEGCSEGRSDWCDIRGA